MHSNLNFSVRKRYRSAVVNFLPRFNVSEGVDGEPPNVLVPGIQQTARAGIGAKREDVCSGNTERLAESISVDVWSVRRKYVEGIVYFLPAKLYLVEVIPFISITLCSK